MRPLDGLNHDVSGGAGLAAMLGGAMGLALAPIMVVVKYMTGWAIVQEPTWVSLFKMSLGGLFQFASPQRLWMIYGSLYTVALLFMLIGVMGLFRHLRDVFGQRRPRGYWVLLAGLCMVIPGDAIHTWTWHQNGLTVPTPGTNPLANAAYAVHMLGMMFVMVGSLMVGVSALRGRFLAPWLAWSFVMVFPAAVVAPISILPTTPSGGLWLFSLTMMTCGTMFLTGRHRRLVCA